MALYWKVTGKTRDKFVAHIEAVSAALNKAKELAARLGVRLWVARNWSLSIEFSPKDGTVLDPTVWRRTKNDRYTPRRATVAGKSISKQFEEIEQSVPGDLALITILGDRGFSTPGFVYNAPQLFVATHDDYKRPARLAKEIVRVSDLVYERAKAEHSKPKRKSRV